MGLTHVGVPVTSCAERTPLRDPPQGKSRAVNTLRCCPAASVGFSPTLPMLTDARVCIIHFFLPPRRKSKKKNRCVRFKGSIVVRPSLRTVMLQLSEAGRGCGTTIDGVTQHFHDSARMSLRLEEPWEVEGYPSSASPDQPNSASDPKIEVYTDHNREPAKRPSEFRWLKELSSYSWSDDSNDLNDFDDEGYTQRKSCQLRLFATYGPGFIHLSGKTTEDFILGFPIRSPRDARRHIDKGTPIHIFLAHRQEDNLPGGSCVTKRIKVEQPHKKSIPGQCFNCQLYEHSSKNCFQKAHCVKCLGDLGTATYTRNKEADGPSACVLCKTSGHTANYLGYPRAPKLKVKPKSNSKKNLICSGRAALNGRARDLRIVFICESDSEPAQGPA
ncbi:hypothetical protein EVAR_17421_1 [Eumeta japonica]|uniref:Nucleic-acid-binding protein from transposon X-element n=1 Tax=Eumeta variegata TaxID=151549 RepID=A0A4C1VA91_EUMVA|nr:hypothetical protein EVAR_17421_1 [Eumeta japonica]